MSEDSPQDSSQDSFIVNQENFSETEFNQEDSSQDSSSAFRQITFPSQDSDDTNQVLINMSHQISELPNQISNLSNQLLDLSNQISNLSNQMTQVDQKLEDLNAEQRDLRNEINYQGDDFRSYMNNIFVHLHSQLALGFVNMISQTHHPSQQRATNITQSNRVSSFHNIQLPFDQDSPTNRFSSSNRNENSENQRNNSDETSGYSSRQLPSSSPVILNPLCETVISASTPQFSNDSFKDNPQPNSLKINSQRGSNKLSKNSQISKTHKSNSSFRISKIPSNQSTQAVTISKDQIDNSQNQKFQPPLANESIDKNSHFSKSKFSTSSN